MVTMLLITGIGVSFFLVEGLIKGIVGSSDGDESENNDGDLHY